MIYQVTKRQEGNLNVNYGVKAANVKMLHIIYSNYITYRKGKTTETAER